MNIQEYRMESPSGKCKFVSNTDTDKRYTIVSGTSLEGIGKTFLKSATRITFSGGEFYNLLGLVLVKDLLGLFYVKGLESVSYTGMTDAFQMMSFGFTQEETSERLRFNEALRIISKHLDADRDILACQEDLLEVGLKEYARL